MNLVGFAMALDRGGSQPDPAGFSVQTRVGSVGEVVEAELLAALTELVRARAATHVEAEDIGGAQGIVTALALSAHRSAETNRLLLELGDRGDALAHSVRSAYLLRSRNVDALRVAWEVVESAAEAPELIQAAFIALARHGVSREAVETRLATALLTAEPQRRRSLVEGLPWLVAPAATEPGGVAHSVFGLLRSELLHGPRIVRSAAAVAISAAVLRSGQGWQIAEVAPRSLVEDGSLSVDARRVLLKRWAPSFFSAGDQEGDIRAIAKSRDLPPALKDALWVDLDESARTLEARRRLAQLAREILVDEDDVDVRAVLERLSAVN